MNAFDFLNLYLAAAILFYLLGWRKGLSALCALSWPVGLVVWLAFKLSRKN